MEKGVPAQTKRNKRKPQGHHQQHIRHHSTSTVGTTVPGVAAVPPAVVSTRRTSRHTTPSRVLVPILHQVLMKMSDYWSEGYGVHFEYHRKFFFESRNFVRPEIQYDLLVSPPCRHASQDFWSNSGHHPLKMATISGPNTHGAYSMQ
jgi:hypothetical protein